MYSNWGIISKVCSGFQTQKSVLTSVNIKKKWRRLQNTVLNLQFPYVCWSQSNNCKPGWAEAQCGTSKNSNQTEEGDSSQDS